MLSQIIRVVLHLCGQRNLMATVWEVRESQGIFTSKESGNPVRVLTRVFFMKTHL